MKKISTLKELHGMENEKSIILIDPDGKQGQILDKKTSRKIIDVYEVMFYKNLKKEYQGYLKELDFDVELAEREFIMAFDIRKGSEKYKRLLKKYTARWMQIKPEETYKDIQRCTMRWFGFKEESNPRTPRDFIECILVSYSFLYCVVRGWNYEQFQPGEHLENDKFLKWIAEYKMQHFVPEILREAGLELIDVTEKGFKVRPLEIPKGLIN